MATTFSVLAKAYTAGEDLSAKQYRFVKFSAENTVHVVDDADVDLPCGVLLNAPANGEIAEVGILGIFPVEAGANLAAGARIQASDAGKAIAAASSGYEAGCTEGDPAADGDVVSCFINCLNPPLKA